VFFKDVHIMEIPFTIIRRVVMLLITRRKFSIYQAVFICFISGILFHSTLFALQPPKEGDITKFKEDGSFNERFEFSKNLGNHKFDQTLVERAKARFDFDPKKEISAITSLIKHLLKELKLVLILILRKMGFYQHHHQVGQGFLQQVMLKFWHYQLHFKITLQMLQHLT